MVVLIPFVLLGCVAGLSNADLDGDGVLAPEDCDDTDPAVYPGAPGAGDCTEIGFDAETIAAADAFLLGYPQGADALLEAGHAEVVELLDARIERIEDPPAYLGEVEARLGSAPAADGRVSDTCDAGPVWETYATRTLETAVPIEAAKAGYAAVPNCVEPRYDDCPASPPQLWVSDLMAYNDHELTTYAANLRIWHESETLRWIVGSPLPVKVAEFAYEGDAPDHQYNVYFCVPELLTWLVQPIEVRQLL